MSLCYSAGLSASLSLPPTTMDTADSIEHDDAAALREAEKRRAKKKRYKANAALKAVTQAAATQSAADATPSQPVLRISRAKHLKYISSYHGQWLQLPLELLSTLLQLNAGPQPSDFADDSDAADLDASIDLLNAAASSINGKGKAAAFIASSSGTSIPGPQLTAVPPAIDTAVFRGVIEIRKLIEAAADLALRAASGLSAAALGAFNENPTPFAHASYADHHNNANGRNQTMSPTRQFRLRAMAVSKLASAYRIDEVAASVAVMQGATALDDLAERVLKVDPNHTEAKYVQFFHEKIPSRFALSF